MKTSLLFLLISFCYGQIIEKGDSLEYRHWYEAEEDEEKQAEEDEADQEEKPEAKPKAVKHDKEHYPKVFKMHIQNGHNLSEDKLDFT